MSVHKPVKSSTHVLDSMYITHNVEKDAAMCLYTSTYRCTWVHSGTQWFKWVHSGTQWYKWVHSGINGYTVVYIDLVRD